MFEVSEEPFLDLPEALVEELLSKCGGVSAGLFASFKRIDDERSQIRGTLIDNDLLHKDSEISSMPVNPTCCGVDGAYAVERLISTHQRPLY